MLTLNQAKQHLAGIKKLAIPENKYLACIRNYLMSVDVEVTPFVRADQFESHDSLRDLMVEEAAVKATVQRFLTEV